MNENVNHDQLCDRCKTKQVAVKGRNHNFCGECFVLYVRTKVVKRMEGFRVRNAKSGSPPRKLLLPLSFGSASLSLLLILDQQLRRQREKVGKTGYQLLVVYVDDSITEKKNYLDKLELLKGHFGDSRSDISFKVAQLEDVYDFKVVNENEVKDEQWSTAHSNSNTARSSTSYKANISCLRELISTLPSRSSQADVLSILRTRLLVEMAKKEGCEGILWGDSTTRLAEKVLAETAKGRGFSIPWQIADGPSPYGITFNYPNRDILKREFEQFIGLANISGLCEPPAPALSMDSLQSANSKYTTIDGLMVQYFGALEDQFPSIVANVVRTASKLNFPQIPEGDITCNICGLPRDGGGIDLDSTMQQLLLRGEGPSTNSFNMTASRLCSGCARSTVEAESFRWPL